MGKNKETDINPIFEWAVWCHLESVSNYELLLLRGHLVLEKVLESLLMYKKIENCSNYSFHRKVCIFEKLNIANKQKQVFVADSLKRINQMRNELAHEFDFNVKSGDLDKWSELILDNLNGTKWTKYTSRIKVVHSFSVLSLNILDFKNE
ncbi:hypothetical protein ACUNWD_09765 [Sunxiuqinia sp. A32]|uniref:hypothetical protein n=1 Tax=Sunxiuqinia sp. A32 TaxID=3461496 RepID=UPI0040460381